MCSLEDVNENVYNDLGHEDIVLCVNWYVASEDDSARIYDVQFSRHDRRLGADMFKA